MTPNSAASVWSGTARLGLGWGLFTGCAGDNRPHAHHAVQIVLSETPQRIWTATQGWQSCRGAVIGANMVHRLEENTQPITLLYLEPDSRVGRRVTNSLLSGWRVLPEALVSSALDAAKANVENPAPSVVSCLFPTGEPQQDLRHDTLIETLIVGLPPALPDGFGTTAMCMQTGLSPSRLQHRFRAHTGLAVRPYLRWRRLLTALQAVTRDLPLTDAALEAGFADAAHFTRTFRRHFGITPGVLLHLNTGVGQP